MWCVHNQVSFLMQIHIFYHTSNSLSHIGLQGDLELMPDSLGHKVGEHPRYVHHRGRSPLCTQWQLFSDTSSPDFMFLVKNIQRKPTSHWGNMHTEWCSPAGMGYYPTILNLKNIFCLPLEGNIYTSRFRPSTALIVWHIIRIIRNIWLKSWQKHKTLSSAYTFV